MLSPGADDHTMNSYLASKPILEKRTNPQSRQQQRDSVYAVRSLGRKQQHRQITVVQLDRKTCPPDNASVLKPKRPRTAYNLFFKDQLKKLNVGKGDGQLSSKAAPTLVSRKWAMAPTSEKCRYYQLAAHDKFRYCNEKIEYNSFMERLRTETRQIREMHATHIPEAASHDEDNKHSESSEDASETQAQVQSYGSLHPRPTVPFISLQEAQDTTRPYSRESIAFLASKLDDRSIDFLIRALK